MWRLQSVQAAFVLSYAYTEQHTLRLVQCQVYVVIKSLLALLFYLHIYVKSKKKCNSSIIRCDIIHRSWSDALFPLVCFALTLFLTLSMFSPITPPSFYIPLSLSDFRSLLAFCSKQSDRLHRKLSRLLCKALFTQGVNKWTLRRRRGDEMLDISLSLLLLLLRSEVQPSLSTLLWRWYSMCWEERIKMNGDKETVCVCAHMLLQEYIK